MNTVREEKLSIGAAMKLCQRMSTHAKDWSVPRLFSTKTSCFPVSDSFAFLMVNIVLVSPTSKNTLKEDSCYYYQNLNKLIVICCVHVSVDGQRLH